MTGKERCLISTAPAVRRNDGKPSIKRKSVQKAGNCLFCRGQRLTDLFELVSDLRQFFAKLPRCAGQRFFRPIPHVGAARGTDGDQPFRLEHADGRLCRVVRNPV